MWKRLLLGIAVSLAWTGWAVAAGELSIGDKAPKIEVKEFVKGDPVTKFDKGKTYVVEFWATWCGPCRTSIPHLTKLQKENKDVIFIGVSVWEEDQGEVKPFVKDMGDKMDYRVALDVVKAGAKGNDGIMAKAWMQAAGQEGIPTAFIVNGDGKIAWIGHPIRMDKPLKEIVAGTWDLAAATEQFKKEKADKAQRQEKQKARQDKLQKLSAKLQAEPTKAVEYIDEAIKEDPELESYLAFPKFHLLAQQKDNADKTLSYGKELMEKYKNNAQGLNQIAWTIVDPKAPKADAKLLKLALEAAQQADKAVKGKEAAIADTLAKAYFDNGDVAKAVENQERAVKLAKGTPLEKDKEMQDRLEQYKKASKKD